MVEPVFGITFSRDGKEPLPVIASDMSTIGYVGTAPGADAAAFPLGQAVLIRTNDTELRAKLGTTGTLPDALRGTAGQLGVFQVAADVIVVREEEGANPAATMANLIGTEAGGNGLFALLDAGEDLGRIPRLLGVPGYTHQMLQALKVGTIVPGNGGTNGTFALAFTGGTGSGGVGTFTVAGGVLTSVEITNHGNYTVAPNLSFAASANLVGAAAPLTLEAAANPVCAALPAICNRLVADAVVEGPGTNETAIKAWRETINHERLIPIDLWVKVAEGDSIVTRPGVSRVLGLAVQVDYENGGVPSHSWANRPIQDIVGFVRKVGFSLTDGATEGQSLLRENVGVGVRGELGVESAASNSGFTFIGTDNAGDDPIWQFYNVSRMRDFIHLGLLRTLRIFLGRNNIEGHVIQAVLNTVNNWLSELQADGHLLDFRVGFEEAQNTVESLRLGKFAFYFKAEEPPVLRRLDISSRRYPAAFDAMVQDLLSTIQTSTAA